MLRFLIPSVYFTFILMYGCGVCDVHRVQNGTKRFTWKNRLSFTICMETGRLIFKKYFYHMNFETHTLFNI